MDGSTVKKIKESLLRRREAIDGMLDRGLGSPTGAIDEPRAEIIDIAQALEALDRDYSIADQERRELLAIERALAKLTNGNYGVCEDCDENISPKRLMVLPEARFCTQCQAVDEQLRNRQTRGYWTAAR